MYQNCRSEKPHTISIHHIEIPHTKSHASTPTVRSAAPKTDCQLKIIFSWYQTTEKKNARYSKTTLHTHTLFFRIHSLILLTWSFTYTLCVVFIVRQSEIYKFNIKNKKILTLHSLLASSVSSLCFVYLYEYRNINETQKKYNKI
jgi:hypothetical protein